MEPARLDIAIYRGDYYSLTLTFQNKTTNEPIDYSAGTFAAQIRPDANSDRVWDFQVNDDDSATGVVVISLLAADTAKMPKACVWDMEIDIGGTVTTLIGGNADVGRDVTRA